MDDQLPVSPEEILPISTPEGVAFSYPVAGIGSRFAALAIDTLIQGALLVALFLGLGAVMAFADAPLPDDFTDFRISGWLEAAFLLAVFAVVWGYFPAFEGLWRGQTPGKRGLGLRVMRIDGRPVTFFDVLIRNILRLADFLPAFYGAGVIAMFLARNRRLGDLAAGTVVVKERAGTTAFHLDNALATRADLALVRRFLKRRRSLAPDRRRALAARIAATVAPRAGLPMADGEDPERFLERLVRPTWPGPGGGNPPSAAEKLSHPG